MPQPPALRLAAATALLAALTGLAACGDDPKGSDAPSDASVTDFCNAIGDLTTSSPKDLVDDLLAVGTPADIPADARAGFEVFIDEADAETISAEDQQKVAALTTYLTEVCVGIPADPEDE